MNRVVAVLRYIHCEVLGWHSPGTYVTQLGYDNQASHCKYCTRRILWSTGGWFAARDQYRS